MNHTLDRSEDDGFTLIELLIVIVILGILATVVVFSVGGVTDKGEHSSCVTDERTLLTAVEAYFGKYNTQTIPATGSDAEQYERSLVTGGLLRNVSSRWTVAGDGTLTAQDSTC
jgi:prepilin-type N-terminal cleavage/methylation domain-containing protein